jgi:hypothetical protein
MASQQEKAFCVLRYEVSRSVITEQREFRARFKKDIIVVWLQFREGSFRRILPGVTSRSHC